MKRLTIALLFVSTAAVASPCGRRGSYAMSVGAGDDVMISGGSLEEVLAARKNLHDEFLWARFNAKSYVIRDLDTIDRARALFAPARELEPQIRDLDEEEDALDHELDDLYDRHSKDKSAIDQLRVRLSEVHRRQRVLDRKEEELSCQAETKMWAIVDDAIRSGLAKRLP